MLTFLILMRIDRAEGAKSYLSKTKTLVLKALGYHSSETLQVNIGEARKESIAAHGGDDDDLTGWSS
jgi:hypothetical protein